MRNEPAAPDLLQLARRILLSELLPSLPPEKRYDALMIAAAMAVAARECTAGSAPMEKETEDLFEFFQGAEQAGSTPDLVAMNRRLAREIRAGTHDASERLYGLLQRTTARYLAEKQSQGACDSRRTVVDGRQKRRKLTSDCDANCIHSAGEKA